jgi:hypothetical protein
LARFQSKCLKRKYRGIFGPKTEEVTGEWRTMQNGKIINLYSSPHSTGAMKRMRVRWAGNVTRMVGKEMHTKFLVCEHQGKRPRRKPSRKWEDNIKTKLKGIWCRLNCINSGQCPRTIMNVRVPYKMGTSSLTSWATVSLSRRTLMYWYDCSVRKSGFNRSLYRFMKNKMLISSCA